MPVRLGRFAMLKRLVREDATATPTFAKFVAEPLEAGSITSDKPFPTAPDIKPLAEVGLPSWPNTVAWQALLAPGGTPKPILEKLNKDVNAAVHSPEMNTPLEKLGMIGLGRRGSVVETSGAPTVDPGGSGAVGGSIHS